MHRLKSTSPLKGSGFKRYDPRALERFLGLPRPLRSLAMTPTPSSRAPKERGEPRIKFIFRPLSSFLFASLCMLTGLQAASWPTMETRARQAIIIDYSSGTVLLEKEADQLTTPSSMTKMMTTYLIFKKLKDGQITEETQLPVSEAAWRMGGSKMFVRVKIG
jgi:D-alanyl-D-alanine carboxypeptidase